MRLTTAARMMVGAAALICLLTVTAFGQSSSRRPGFHASGKSDPVIRGRRARGRPSRPNSVEGVNDALPIYDVHMHIIGGVRSGLFTGAIDAALKFMNMWGVRKAVVMSPPRGPGIKQNFDYSEFIKYVRTHPTRLAFMGGGGTLNPLMHSIPDPAKVTVEAQRKFADSASAILTAGAVGFGEMSSLHISLSPKHGYNFVSADHPLLLRLADIAAERDVPIDLHMDTLSKPIPTPQGLSHNQNPPTLPATLPALRRLLEHNVKTKVVWAHGGSDKLGEQTAQLIGHMMDRYPNLYMSLRPVPPPAPLMNKLFTLKRIDPAWREVLIRHADRFVIGNDCFFLSPEVKSGGAPFEFSQSNDQRLRATRAFLNLLPSNLARKIAFENAARIYKLGSP